MMRFKGEVVHGEGIGHGLGFATANINIAQDSTIDKGVYLSRVNVENNSYRAISNLGCKPTVGGKSVALESHLLDYTGNLYGKKIEVELIEKIRDEKHFDSVAELQKQVSKDIEYARRANH